MSIFSPFSPVVSILVSLCEEGQPGEPFTHSSQLFLRPVSICVLISVCGRDQQAAVSILVSISQFDTLCVCSEPTPNTDHRPM